MILILSTIVACSNTPETSSTHTLPVTSMVFELADTSNITVQSFNLGYHTLSHRYVEDLEIPISGMIATPSTSDGSYPVALILHGRSGIQDIHDPLYAGFDYLIEQLAAQGYIAISVNINASFIFDTLMYDEIIAKIATTYNKDLDDFDNGRAEAQTILSEFADEIEILITRDIIATHLHHLDLANDGLFDRHGINLENMVDMSDINLIGHSRGGALIDDFARVDIANGNDRIRSLVRLTPLVFDNDGSHPDLPTAIIISEFDNDLPDHIGVSVFDDVLASKTNASLMSLVYVRGANHNYFSRMFESDDRFRENGAFFVALENEDLWPTREEQETFLVGYVSMFLDTARGIIPKASHFDTGVAQPHIMFGLDVISSTYVANAQDVFGEIVEASNNLQVEAHIQLAQNYGNPHLFKHPINPINPINLPMTSIQWRSGNDEDYINISPLVSDFSHHQALSFYIATDSSNELNASYKNQAFTVSLVDTLGNTSEVVIEVGTPALSAHPGIPFRFPDFISEEQLEGLDKEQDIHPWQGHMLIGELRIPLSYFDNVDMSDISSIHIHFNKTGSGAIMLRDVLLK